MTNLQVSTQTVYQLWQGRDAPFSKENCVKEYEQESWGDTCVFNVTEPTLTVYPAQGENSGAGVVVIPGGGYVAEAIVHEGHKIAKILAAQGVTAAVLKYRLPNPATCTQPQAAPAADARRALKLLRQLAELYGINKDNVGVLGFSAGSHLATVVSLWKSADPEESPNFSGLIYGVTDLSEANLHWLEESLYFRKLTDEELAQNRLLDWVSQATPRAFLAHACDDQTCNVKESTLYAQKLLEHQAPVELHLFPQGGHGFGAGRPQDGTDQWLSLFVNWIKRNRQ